MTIREYIELQQKIYGLNEDTFDRIKVKISRELIHIPEWFKLEEYVKIRGKKSILLNKEVKKKLDEVMKPYFLKLANFDKTAIDRQKHIHQVIIDNTYSNFKHSFKNDEDAYIYPIPKEEKMITMIEALFYSQFKLDEQLWIDDYSNYQSFLENDYPQSTDEIAIIKLRLDNPLKYYVSKK